MQTFVCNTMYFQLFIPHPPRFAFQLKCICACTVYVCHKLHFTIPNVMSCRVITFAFLHLTVFLTPLFLSHSPLPSGPYKNHISWMWVAVTAAGDVWGWGTLIKRPIYSSSCQHGRAAAFGFDSAVCLFEPVCLSPSIFVYILFWRAWLTLWVDVMSRA